MADLAAIERQRANHPTARLIDEAIERGARLRWEEPSSTLWFPNEGKPLHRYKGVSVAINCGRGPEAIVWTLWRNVEIVDASDGGEDGE